MRIENEVKLDFKDVLIRPKRSILKSRSDVDITRKFTFKNSGKTWQGVPIISANMDHTGTIEVAKELGKHGILTALSKFINEEEYKKTDKKIFNKTFISAGIGETSIPYLKTAMAITNAPFICLDVANGYSQPFIDFVKQVREEFPEKTIMAGNVVTGEMVEELIIAGADIIKVGIGPGSVCTTRKKTGVGYPQLSAIIECADAAHGLKGYVCADGGCTVGGDIAKAFAGGADFVMLGGMLAGHDECLGEVFINEKTKQKAMRYYGMSSAEAMNKYHGGVASYRASEGKSVDVPYKGAINETVLEILGGIRSTCTYVGAEHLKELTKRTTFIRVTQQLNDIFTPFNAG